MRLDIKLPHLMREIDALIGLVPQMAEDEDLRRDMIEGATKIDDVIRYVIRKHGEAKAASESLTDYADQIAAKAKRHQDRADAFKAIAERVLNAANLDGFKLPEGGSLSYRNNPPRPVIIDEAAIPRAFKRVVETVDVAAIKEALKAGTPVEGVAMSNGSRSLVIRGL